MGKKKGKSYLPTIEKMNEKGFQDGYYGVKSKEIEYLNTFVKRNINKDLVKQMILSYCLGYKKGQVILFNGVDNCKIKNGEVALNNSTIKLDEQKINIIEENVDNAKVKAKKKRR